MSPDQTGFATSTICERFNNRDIKACGGDWWNSPPKIIPRRHAAAVQFLAGYVPRITQIGPQS
jgi:hypothetical protein